MRCGRRAENRPPHARSVRFVANTGPRPCQRRVVVQNVCSRSWMMCTCAVALTKCWDVGRCKDPTPPRKNKVLEQRRFPSWVGGNDGSCSSGDPTAILWKGDSSCPPSVKSVEDSGHTFRAPRVCSESTAEGQCVPPFAVGADPRSQDLQSAWLLLYEGHSTGTSFGVRHQPYGWVLAKPFGAPFLANVLWARPILAQISVSQSVRPSRVGARRVGAQIFSLLCPSPATSFALSLGGLLVEFWWCLETLEFSGCCVKPAAPKPLERETERNWGREREKAEEGGPEEGGPSGGPAEGGEDAKNTTHNTQHNTQKQTQHTPHTQHNTTHTKHTQITHNTYWPKTDWP